MICLKTQMPIRLINVLQQLRNEAVTLELKNGSVITGTIVSVDQSMTTHLQNVKVTVKDKEAVLLDELSIRGSTIRFFVFPETFNVDGALQKASAGSGQGKKVKGKK